MGSMDELRSPSLPTSPAAPVIVFPSPSMLSVLQLLGTIRCPKKPRAAHAEIVWPRVEVVRAIGVRCCHTGAGCGHLRDARIGDALARRGGLAARVRHLDRRGLPLPPLVACTAQGHHGARFDRLRSQTRGARSGLFGLVLQADASREPPPSMI